VDEVEDLLEQQQPLLRLAQARADHDAIKPVIPQRRHDACLRALAEIDEAARDLVAGIAQAQELRVDIGADKLGRELRKRAVIRMNGFDADRKHAFGHSVLQINGASAAVAAAARQRTA